MQAHAEGPFPFKLTDLLSTIRRQADQSDREGELPRKLIDQMADAGIFRLLATPSLGGLGLDAVTASRVFEAIASEDGSTGWVAMAGNGSYFAGFLEVNARKEVVETSRGMPIGTAFTYPGSGRSVDGGYRLTGKWNYVTGVTHNSWTVVTFDVTDSNGQIHEKRNAFLPSKDWTVIKTWTSTGLYATASHSLEVKDVFVPIERTYKFGIRPLLDEGVYRLPVRALMAVIEASIPLGIALGARKEFSNIASKKMPSGSAQLLADQPLVQINVAQAEALRRAAQTFLFDSIQQLSVASESSVTEEVSRATALARLAATHACVSAVRAVDLFKHSAGASVLSKDSRLGRAFRDIHAAAQHMMISQKWYQPVGRTLLGREPGAPL